MSELIFPSLYQTLAANEIRVLKLLPGCGVMTICCDLTIISLDTENIEYEALSYTWGADGTGSRTGFDLNGSPIQRDINVCSQELTITENLYNALRNLRNSQETRTLWIDAICINQVDMAERSAQVALMAIIYRSAVRVLIWLGVENQASRGAFSFVEWANTANHEPREIFQDETRNSTYDVGRIFHERSYWSRRWIIQEIMHAKDLLIICGSQTLPWDSLQKLQPLLINAFGQPAERKIFQNFQLSRMEVMLKTVWNIGNARLNAKLYEGEDKDRDARPSLHEALDLFKDNNCSDDRDYIYAILNICNFRTPRLVVDYNKSVFEVFADATRSVIRESGSLQILARNTWFEPKKPTWSPVFSNPHTWNFDGHELFGSNSEPLYSAAANTVIGESTSVFTDWRVLHLKGVFHDEFELFDGDPVEISNDPYPTGELRFDVYWRTLMRDVYHPFIKPPRSWEEDSEKRPQRLTSEDIARYRAFFLSGETAPAKDADELDSDHCDSNDDYRTEPKYDLLSRYGRSKLGLSPGHQFRFFVIKSGYMGLIYGNVSASAGDHIYVVEGCGIPMILRRARAAFAGITTPDENRSYRFIGMAYVHGIMDGEVMEKVKTGEKVLQDLFLI